MSMFDPSNLPPPVVTPMMPPSGMVFHVDYDYHNTNTGLSEVQKELNSYITERIVGITEQKKWTEKTIRTREKLEKLEKSILDNTPVYEGIPPMGIVGHLLSSVQVDESPLKYFIRVRMLSREGVEWCNQMWEKLDRRKSLNSGRL